jgi:predicted phage baseplate assembly protein
MLETCGCCEGIKKLTPMTITNRPGLSQLSYRVGTHASFLEMMMAALSTNYLEIPTDEFDDQEFLKTAVIAPLQGLAVRTESDPSIALLDAWATVADVLTFYQERIANEGYLRTATERRSILELARLVGYTLRPGVAASVYLAYTLDNGSAVIPAGARAQSIPGDKEMPQSFETSKDLEASASWNDLEPRKTRPKLIELNSSDLRYNPRKVDTLYFKGISINLNPNDPLLFVFCEDNNCNDIVLGPVRSVLTSEPQPTEDRTKVNLQDSQKKIAKPEKIEIKDLLTAGTLLKLPSRPPRSDLDLDRSMTDTFSESSDVSLKMIANLNPLLKNSLYPALANAQVTGSSSLDSVHAFRVKAAPFGNNAPLKPVFDDKGVFVGQEEWPLTGVMTVSVRLFLDGNTPFRSLVSIVRGSKVLIQEVDVENSKAYSIGELNLKVTINRGSGEFPPLIGIDYEIPELKEIIKLTIESSGWGVKVRDEDKIVVSSGQKLQLTGGKGNILVDFENNLLVSDGMLLSPDPKNVISLDARYDKIIPGSFVIIERHFGCNQSKPIIAKVKEVKTISRTDYGLTANVTELALDKDWLCDDDFLITVLRQTTVYAQSEPLDLAEEPVDEPVCKNDIELDGLYRGLQPGRWVIISGERADIEGTSGVAATELAMLAGVKQDVFKVEGVVMESSHIERDLPDDKLHTFLHLASDLSYCYKRDTVTIYGNVAEATHGETHKDEVLGSGDATKPGQSFTLHQSPLTFISAVTTSGIDSTLKVSVDDIFWHETDSLSGLGPTDRKYITLRDDDDKTTVAIGDGKHGARPHTGVENIKATYRTGIGKPGNVRAGQISQLMTRPLGVSGVINPMPATGGADREDRDQARQRVPLALMALDRLVSVKDYGDFARTFGGIGKASSAKLSDGQRQVVHVTIAGEDDIPIDTSSDLYKNLIQALRKFGDQDQPIQVDVRDLIMLVISAKVRAHPDYQWASVKPKVQAALLDAFSFGKRDLGQDATLSEAISAIQSVPGVAYVDVDIFDGIHERDEETDGPLTPKDIADRMAAIVTKSQIEGPNPRVRASMEVPVKGGIRPAQVAYLVPSIAETLKLTELI